MRGGGSGELLGRFRPDAGLMESVPGPLFARRSGSCIGHRIEPGVPSWPEGCRFLPQIRQQTLELVQSTRLLPVNQPKIHGIAIAGLAADSFRFTSLAKRPIDLFKSAARSGAGSLRSLEGMHRALQRLERGRTVAFSLQQGQPSSQRVLIAPEFRDRFINLRQGGFQDADLSSSRILTGRMAKILRLRLRPRALK